MKTDMQIQNDVLDQLKWEPSLNATRIGVSVNNGVVTLTGQVNTYAKKIAAERAVKKVAGVRAVAEEIQVCISPAARWTDTEIAVAVAAALQWHTAVMEGRIKIRVEDGVVTLEGEVERNFQCTSAANDILGVAGVQKVNNLIIVRPAHKPVDIRREIIAAFHRHAAIDGEKIIVDLRGGNVTLRGKVCSLAEKEEAEYAARSAPGVRDVKNDLEIEEKEYEKDNSGF